LILETVTFETGRFGDIEEELRPATNAVIAALDDDQTRADAARVLAKIGKDGADTISKKMVSIVNAKARMACIEVLGEIGHDSSAVRQGLTILSLRDPVAENQEAARRGLNKLSGKG
jgi:hypothetical protein